MQCRGGTCIIKRLTKALRAITFACIKAFAIARWRRHPRRRRTSSSLAAVNRIGKVRGSPGVAAAPAFASSSAPPRRLPEMVRQELRTLDCIGAKLDQGSRDLAVQLGPLVAEKRADGRVLDQCVFELIAFAVGISSRVDKLSLDQVVQCPLDRGSVSLTHRDQKFGIEHSTQERSHLNDLSDRRQSIQTGVKCVLQGRRNFDGRPGLTLLLLGD
jgi:hypothetical protein